MLRSKRLIFSCLVAFAVCHHAAAEWASIGPPLAVESLAFSADGVLYAGTDHGVYRRNPVTGAWESRSLGLPDLPVAALIADPLLAGVLYAGELSRSSIPGGVFKTSDGGLTWTSASIGLTGTLVKVLAIDPRNPATLYAGTNSGGVYKSEDAAGHWRPMNSGLTGVSVWSIAVDPIAAGTVYVGISEGVFKSTDGGLSWRAINTGLQTPTMPYTAAGLAIDPTNNSTIYLASFVPLSLPVGGGVYKTTNGGATWTPVNTGSLHPAAMSAIVLDPHSPTTVYAAGQAGGVALTTDGGGSWSNASSGLTYEALTLSIDPIAGSLYAGTRGGVFQLSAGSGTCTADPGTLCLNSARFKVQVTWRVPSQGMSGWGQAVPMTSDTGAFWFFSSNNIEIVVKVVDGRPFNGKFWVFYGALSNVEYTISVTDTAAGIVKTYFNPEGRLASIADTAAF